MGNCRLTRFALPLLVRLMKQFILTIAVLGASCAVSLAGPEQYSGKDMKQVATPTPCPEWYGDQEWNVSVWGAYAFTGTNSNRTGIEDTDDLNDIGSYDRFLGGDHAWGGGTDLKYFFHRYFGIGVEGFALAGHGTHAVLDHGSAAAASEEFYSESNHTVGAALATFTLRYPIGCSRFAPYVWGGGGGIFGGRSDRAVGHDLREPGFPDRFVNDEESRGMGQVGGGLEVRITRHIGITGDFSWNVVDGTHNNFGMARTGLNFAF
jgi:hypothetical protein